LLLVIVCFLATSLAGAGVRGKRRSGRAPEVIPEDGGIWTTRPENLDRKSLNPRGDLWGDGAPHFAEAPDGSWLAVWSLADRDGRDVVVSRFDGESWSPPEWVVSDNGRDDLDPRAGFLSSGKPVIVWWDRGTRRDRTPRVVLSWRTDEGWSSPWTVSPDETAAWRPSIRVEGNDVFVAFNTPEGIVIERILFVEGHGGTNGPSPFPGKGKNPGGGDQSNDVRRPPPKV
jgi:hypothetical protein